MNKLINNNNNNDNDNNTNTNNNHNDNTHLRLSDSTIFTVARACGLGDERVEPTVELLLLLGGLFEDCVLSCHCVVLVISCYVSSLCLTLSYLYQLCTCRCVQCYLICHWFACLLRSFCSLGLVCRSFLV